MNGSLAIDSLDGEASLISALSRRVRSLRTRLAFFPLMFARVGKLAACWFGHQAPPISMVPQDRSVYEQHRRRAAFSRHRSGGAS
jgi:hypothetical protein